MGKLVHRWIAMTVIVSVIAAVAAIVALAGAIAWFLRRRGSGDVVE